MRTYRVVIIGAGNIGAFFDKPDSEEILTHANAFRKDEHFILMGFFDSDYEKAKEAADRWQVKAYETFEEAMSQADVVSCAVPDKYHASVLKQIAEYPVKLVFAEKPITKNPEEAEEIVTLYQKKNIKILVNYTRRYVSEFIELKKRLPEYGRFIRGTGYYGKGILHNGSHMIDFIQYLLGKVSNVRGEKPFVDFEQGDPSLEACMQVAGGVFYMHPLDCRVATLFEMDFLFEKGRIRFLDGGSVVEEYQVLPSTRYAGYENYTLVKQYEVHYDSSFRNALKNIYDVLEEKDTLRCTKEEAASVLQICCALQMEMR